jgi:hypothetical protein
LDEELFAFLKKPPSPRKKPTPEPEPQAEVTEAQGLERWLVNARKLREVQEAQADLYLAKARWAKARGRASGWELKAKETKQRAEALGAQIAHAETRLAEISEADGVGPDRSKDE